MINISIVQFKPKLFKIKENVDTAINLIKNEKTDLFLFPELAFSGYSFSKNEEVKEVSENPKINKGYAFNKFKDFCIKNNVNIVYGFVEEDRNKFYNSSILIKKDGSFKIYRKTHLFYNEKKFFSNGNTGFFIENIKGVNIGLAICFDWFFPESFRTLSLMGADIILHSANLVMPYCQNANITRSLENRVYIATANTWGEEINNKIKNTFTGMSQLTDPFGNIIKRFPPQKNIVETFFIDEKLSRNKNINEKNNIFEDRKIQFYK
ncbi:apolipoprotein N-acyltransferase [Tepiditoga spiralis]|uniref:Apolipoprotein N-acyltransferase n=1 Tax=Tepiditoga spiralis TaxID=2108365 RepID=A0A7G1G8U8_9BACT|nr:nitrilase-related carbon-nitrogen hydrolase [Tepiditoga spiralis]BBE31343.1 apolipoprotein N-acyltransferase [Tepiditoga spiralis]